MIIIANKFKFNELNIYIFTDSNNLNSLVFVIKDN